MTQADYYEARCERCRTSFAPGTRQCIHCGGPIGRRRFGLEPPGVPRTAGPGADEARQPELSGGAGRLFRGVLIALAVGVALVRACNA